jgi:hypothetical protein
MRFACSVGGRWPFDANDRWRIIRLQEDQYIRKLLFTARRLVPEGVEPQSESSR